LYILKCVITDDNLLEAILIKIHCEVYIGKNRSRKDCIINDIINYRSICKRRLWTLEWEMFEVNRDLCVDPARVDKLVAAHSKIALVLRIY
jgi:hypothetical protein